jgi:hypothetical protein
MSRVKSTSPSSELLSITKPLRALGFFHKPLALINCYMAQDIGVHGNPATSHNQICPLHENSRMKKCWGTLRSGRICLNRATCPSMPGILPTCKVHLHQVKELAWCKAPLACGFRCGKLLEWEPLGFQLCTRHREDLETCYFLKIPIEIRCRIYRLLLPATDIPARFYTWRSLTTHIEQVYTAILRVNHQIHEEATSLLYGTNIFAIAVTEDMLSMCNLPRMYMQYVRYESLLQDQI